MLAAMPSLPPSSPVLERLSSHDVEPSQRFDAWRVRAHRWVEMLPPPPNAELDAELLLLQGDDCVFGTMRSSAYEMRAASHRMAHAPEMVVITLVQAGEMLRDAASGEHQRIRPGTLGLYDPGCMGSYRWSQDSREVFLALPREEAASALGCEPVNLAIAPERCALAPLLASQLSHLALLMRQPGRVDDIEYAGLLSATRKLALLTLRNLGRQGLGVDLPDLNESLSQGRYAAALRFMENNAHRHDLDAAAIAQGAGCSRTRLYEAFAVHGATVMGALRELRLQRARSFIEQSPRLHVGTLSWRCGFTELSNFSKLFKARFGMPPSEWHRKVWAQPGLDGERNTP